MDELSERKNIDDLYAEFLKYFNAIKSKHNNFGRFQVWISEESKFLDGSGLLGPAITKLRNDLENYKDIKGLDGGIRDIDTNIEKARRFIEAAKVFLSLPDKIDLTGEEWFIYFFYQMTAEDEPQLGRNILKIVSPEKAVLLNIHDGNSEDYSGDFNPVHNSVIFFNLRPEMGDRELHIKFYWRGKQEISLGSYNTYEGNEIVFGSMVAYRIPKAVPSEKRVPQLWSYREMSDENALNDVEATIIDYLSVKGNNHHVVPIKRTTIGSLKKYIHRISHHENTQDRFIETGNPIVFIATPNTTIKNKDSIKEYLNCINQITEKLKGEFPRLNIGDNNVFESISWDKMPPPESLRILQRTRVFILVIAETDKASFSLVQLGWAIAFCKHVIIVYKEKTVSERIKSLGKLGVERISFTDLRSEIDDVTDRLVDLIKLYL